MEPQSEATNNALLNSAVIEELERILAAKFYKQKYSYVVVKATEKGDNYLGVIYRIIVQLCDTQHQQNNEIFKLIVKVPPANLFQRKQFFARPSFVREALAYDEFLSLLHAFQLERGLADDDIFKAYPKCFGTLKHEMNEAIFLEDMSEHGFVLFDRFKELNAQHVALVMRAYGQLHAVSFALKQQEPGKIQQFQVLDDVLGQRSDPQMLIYYDELKKRTLSTLTRACDHKYKRHLMGFFEENNSHDLLTSLIDGNKAEPYAVVCHGDCWNNNILFQYSEQQEVLKACLLDWQIMRYASPITDIVYYLFTSTTYNFRQKYYMEMLDIYYDSLAKHMEKLGSKPKELFPRATFNKELKKYAAVALIFAMIVLPLATTRPEDVPNLEELGELIESGGNINDLDNSSFLDGGKTDLYQQRMRDVVVDMIDLGYI